MAEIIQGITWGHSRGITPLLAVSQRYAELQPDVEIKWEKRTLQQFADYPVEELTKKYDLLIIDHPWVGRASATNCVLPLNEYLPEEYLQDQLQHSVGNSHLSYQYNNHHWALAIDAATPAASYRKDLLEKNRTAIPQTWQELIVLAKTGKVALPGIPIDTLMNFYTFCLAYKGKLFEHHEEIADKQTGIQAIKTMKQLYGLLNKEMFQFNPIAVAERMSTTDDYWYCPFAYAYSNYARSGYAKHLLHYTDVVSFNNNKLKTTIGGTGLAVSAFSKHRNVALDFAKMIVSGECQRTMYVQHGGQPGHRSAWTDGEANSLTHNFFTEVLPVMDNGYTRPRYNGYLHFQDHAGEPLQQCLLNNTDPEKALNEMNKIYRQSRIKEQSIIIA
ncbi:MAG: extracellular solute-binding protein [Bacteroidota bacterium]